MKNSADECGFCVVARKTQTTLMSRTVTQRVGTGYALTRDVYFSPYLTILPSRLAMDTTTFNLSTVFSVL